MVVKATDAEIRGGCVVIVVSLHTRKASDNVQVTVKDLGELYMS